MGIGKISRFRLRCVFPCIKSSQVVFIVFFNRRMVPIELPTRHRRVHRIVFVTSIIAVSLVARSVILVWLSDKTVQLTTGVRNPA